MNPLEPPQLGLTGVEVTHWAMRRLSLGSPPQAQAEHLSEDLAQAVLPGGALLDIGWYPEADEAGAFLVLVVAAGDWEAPLFRRRATTWAALRDAVAAALRRAQEDGQG